MFRIATQALKRPRSSIHGVADARALSSAQPASQISFSIDTVIAAWHVVAATVFWIKFTDIDSKFDSLEKKMGTRMDRIEKMPPQA